MQESGRRLWLLGPVCVERGQRMRDMAAPDSRELPRFRSQRTVALLGYLAAERRAFGRVYLAGLFWPDEMSAKGRANLSRELHNLSQILPGCWELDRRTAAFVPSETTSVDLYKLLELEAQERWVEAAELLGGEFLEGLNLKHNSEFENWLLGERERWRGRTETILRRVIMGYTNHGRYSDALQQTQRLLQLAPWDEDTHQHAMRLLAWTGQRGAALRQFESCKKALAEHLDVQPGVETNEIFLQIRNSQFGPPPQIPAFLSEDFARPVTARPLFVGKENELAQLDGYMDAALAGKGRVIFISGGPGRGKTALLQTFAQKMMAENPNLLVASGNCNVYSGVGDPYLPYRDVMTMLTGGVEGRWEAGNISGDHARRLWAIFPLVVQKVLDLGPDLLDVLVSSGELLALAAAAGHYNSPWFISLQDHVNRKSKGAKGVAQSQLFQQVTGVFFSLAKERPLLLLLDDIQWADTATISLLFHLGRRLAEGERRILIACAYRPDEVQISRTGERHPLAKVLSEFKRIYGDIFVDLSKSDEGKERGFVNALLDAQPNRLTGSFRSALFERTAGYPLFTVELLQSMKERGDLLLDENGAWIEGSTLDWELLPARVEAVIAERIDRLDPELRDILSIASVEGMEFTANVVAAVLSMAEMSTLRYLSQDLERQHRLVSEQEEIEVGHGQLSRYRFGHVLYQEYLYNELGRGERRLLHQDVADALEKIYAGRLDEMAVQLSYHFFQAGNFIQAYQYSILAAERAAQVFASKEAITHFTRAIQLAENVSPDALSLAKIYRGRGVALERVGEFDRSDEDHNVSLQLACTAADQQAEWRAHLDLGRLWASRDYSQARNYFTEALNLARDLDDPALLADSLNWMGNWYANDGDHSKAVDHHQEALRIFEDLGDQQELANTLDLLAITNMLGGDLHKSAGYYNRAIGIFLASDDRPRLLSSLIGRATTVAALAWLASFPPNPPPRADLDFQEALRIANDIGSAADQAWAHYSWGMLHTIHGQFGRALNSIQNSMSIAVEIEHREYEVGARFALGLLYVELFAFDQAQEQLKTGLALAQELRSPTWIQSILGALAGVYVKLGEHKQAMVCLEKAIAEQSPMDTLARRYCWVWRAELALAQGDLAVALHIVEGLISSTPSMAPGRIITCLWKLKAGALAAQGQVEEALDLLYEAIVNSEETGERYLQWQLHARRSQLFSILGQDVEAKQEESATLKLVEELAGTLPDESWQNSFRQGALGILRSPPGRPGSI